MGKRKLVKVKPVSVTVLLVGVALLLLMALLARFDVIDLSAHQANILTLMGSFFLMSEVAVKEMLKKLKRGKINALNLTIGLVALVSIAGVVLTWTGWAIPYAATILSVAGSLLLIFVFVEIFR